MSCTYDVSVADVINNTLMKFGVKDAPVTVHHIQRLMQGGMEQVVVVMRTAGGDVVDISPNTLECVKPTVHLWVTNKHGRTFNMMDFEYTNGKWIHAYTNDPVFDNFIKRYKQDFKAGKRRGILNI